MSSFFASPQPNPRHRRLPWRSPSWMGAPDNWVPGIVPFAVIVGRSDGVAASVSRIAAFPAGFEFDVTTSLRSVTDPDGPMGRMMHGPDAMLVGLEYANGARAPQAPRQPVGGGSGDLRLLPRGGHGSETSLRQTFWASPLPPAGPVTFAVAWPAGGLAESTVSIEGAVILEAAERATQLWPDEPDSLPEADFSNAPPLPPGGSRPADAEASEASIRRAFGQVFDNSPEYPTDPLGAVQDGSALTGVLEQVRARFPMQAATSRVVLGQVAFLDEVRAAVTFEIVWAGGGFGAQLGYAVRERGEWKVARDTYCRFMGMAGIPCPPAPPVL